MLSTNSENKYQTLFKELNEEYGDHVEYPPEIQLLLWCFGWIWKLIRRESEESGEPEELV